MIELEMHATGSSGNAYILTDGESRVLLDAGVYVPGEIDAVLVSHEHRDHCKYVEDYIENNTAVYAPASIAEKWGACQLVDGDVIQFAQVSIKMLSKKTLGLQHDSENICGFAVFMGGMTFGYITDTGKIENTSALEEFDCAILECNYNGELLRTNIDYPAWLKDRVKSNHLSDWQFERYKSHITGLTVPIHMSDQNMSGGALKEVSAYSIAPGEKIDLETGDISPIQSSLPPQVETGFPEKISELSVDKQEDRERIGSLFKALRFVKEHEAPLKKKILEANDKGLYVPGTQVYNTSGKKKVTTPQAIYALIGGVEGLSQGDFWEACTVSLDKLAKAYKENTGCTKKEAEKEVINIFAESISTGESGKSIREV